MSAYRLRTCRICGKSGATWVPVLGEGYTHVKCWKDATMLDQLERLYKAAITPAMLPLEVQRGPVSYKVLAASRGVEVATCPGLHEHPKREAALLAAAVNALPALLRVARAAQAVSDERFGPTTDFQGRAPGAPDRRAALRAALAELEQTTTTTATQ